MTTMKPPNDLSTTDAILPHANIIVQTMLHHVTAIKKSGDLTHTEIVEQLTVVMLTRFEKEPEITALLAALILLRLAGNEPKEVA